MKININVSFIIDYWCKYFWVFKETQHLHQPKVHCKLNFQWALEYCHREYNKFCILDQIFIYCFFLCCCRLCFFCNLLIFCFWYFPHLFFISVSISLTPGFSETSLNSFPLPPSLSWLYFHLVLSVSVTSISASIFSTLFWVVFFLTSDSVTAHWRSLIAIL